MWTNISGMKDLSFYLILLEAQNGFMENLAFDSARKVILRSPPFTHLIFSHVVMRVIYHGIESVTATPSACVY